VPGGKGLNFARRALWGLSALSPASAWLFLTHGRKAAADYLAASVRLYRGYGVIPLNYTRTSWRRDFAIPAKPPEELFPEADFVTSPELLFPYHMYLGIRTHELILICQLIRALKPSRIVEFGIAGGRTTVNLAKHSPPDCQIIAVDPPDCGPRSFYQGTEFAQKITERLVDLTKADWKYLYDSVDFVFCDACDQYKDLAIESSVALSMVRLGGTVLWHDYGSGEDRTTYLNKLGEDLPLANFADTHLVCLRVASPDLLRRARLATRKEADRTSG
jgi:hypothetical protein